MGTVEDEDEPLAAAVGLPMHPAAIPDDIPILVTLTHQAVENATGLSSEWIDRQLPPQWLLRNANGSHFEANKPQVMGGVGFKVNRRTLTEIAGTAQGKPGPGVFFQTAVGAIKRTVGANQQEPLTYRAGGRRRGFPRGAGEVAVMVLLMWGRSSCSAWE